MIFDLPRNQIGPNTLRRAARVRIKVRVRGERDASMRRLQTLGYQERYRAEL
jgi:hypothetical protein